jgi:hypothetical protein
MKIENCSVFDRNEYENIMEAIRTRKTNSHPIYSYIDDKEANTIMAVIQNLLEDSVPLEEVQPEVIMHSPHKEEAIYLLKKLQTTYLHDVDSEGEPKMSIIELVDLWHQVNEYLHDK